MKAHRFTHYAILLAAMAALTLPNLGAQSLWDVDEGVNAEAAREMMEAGTWISPLFNFELRTAKPALLYWLQMSSYRAFGVNEFAARFPSAVAGMATVLLVYELARRMFTAATGLLAGIVLASALEFCMLAHAATPDAVLLTFTTLTLYFFWIGSSAGSRTAPASEESKAVKGGRSWFLPCGMSAGLAVLTKGPVGIILPSAVIFTYLLWNRELHRLLDRRLFLALLGAFLVAAPWYILVTVETRGVWIKEFIGRDNFGRFTRPLEEHSGPIYYHAAGILILFAPWSILIGATFWNTVRELRRGADGSHDEPGRRSACRFLLCWIGVYLLVFSIAATKLPNYVLPVYPALAILTARCLEQWRTARKPALPRWIMPTTAGLMALVGLVCGIGLALAGGLVSLPQVRMHTIPGLGDWLWLGLIPVAGSMAAGFFLVRKRRTHFVAGLATTAVLFVAALAAFPASCLDAQKAPRRLVEQAGLRQPNRDIRLISLHWLQPSVLFYSRREVERFNTWPEAAHCLAMNHPVYLFVPEPVWSRVRQEDPHASGYRTIARQFDFLKNYDVLVVTNQ